MVQGEKSIKEIMLGMRRFYKIVRLYCQIVKIIQSAYMNEACEVKI
jgi:hypothetical protein